MRDVSPRLVGVVGASCLLAGWLLGSTVRPPVAHTQAAASPTVRQAPLPVAAFPSVAEARARLAVAAGVPSPVRNPFMFGGASRPAGRRGDASAVAEAGDAAPEAAAVEATPPPPVWALVGVALEQGAAGEQVTAILSDGRDVHLATAGAALPGGVFVVRVAADHAVLQDASGAELIVRLP